MKLRLPESVHPSKNHPVRRKVDEIQRDLANENWMISKPWLKHSEERKRQLEETLEGLKAQLPENKIANKMADLRAQARRPIRKLPEQLPQSAKEKAA